MRQATITVMGFICAELARVSYGSKATDGNLSKSITTLGMYAKFKAGKDQQQSNSMAMSYGELLKFTGPVFSNSNRQGVNLNNMEWLSADEQKLPDYIRKSLTMIGGTRKAVERIISEKNVSYNRVVFLNNKDKLSMVTLYENEEYMVHAPLMIMCTMRIFSSSTTSYASCKLSKKGSYCIVKVFSNRCVDTKLYHQQGHHELECLSRTNKSTIDEMIEKIKREVSCVLPRIDANRIKMLAPDMTDDEFALLVAAVRENNIEVIGICTQKTTVSDNPRADMDQPQKCKSDEGSSHPEPKKIKLDQPSVACSRVATDSGCLERRGKESHQGPSLMIFDDDVDFGFDDSD